MPSPYIQKTGDIRGHVTTYKEYDGVQILAEELWKMTECFVQHNEQADEHGLMATHHHTTHNIMHHV